MTLKNIAKLYWTNFRSAWWEGFLQSSSYDNNTKFRSPPPNEATTLTSIPYFGILFPPIHFLAGFGIGTSLLYSFFRTRFDILTRKPLNETAIESVHQHLADNQDGCKHALLIAGKLGYTARTLRCADFSRDNTSIKYHSNSSYALAAALKDQRSKAKEPVSAIIKPAPVKVATELKIPLDASPELIKEIQEKAKNENQALLKDYEDSQQVYKQTQDAWEDISSIGKAASSNKHCCGASSSRFSD